MNDNTRNEFASFGLEILKRSALLVLYERHVKSPYYRPYLPAKQVGEELGIRQGVELNHNHLIRGILEHLEDDGYVECMGHNRWQITRKGVSIIEG